MLAGSAIAVAIHHAPPHVAAVAIHPVVPVPPRAVHAVAIAAHHAPAAIVVVTAHHAPPHVAAAHHAPVVHAAAHSAPAAMLAPIHVPRHLVALAQQHREEPLLVLVERVVEGSHGVREGGRALGSLGHHPREARGALGPLLEPLRDVEIAIRRATVVAPLGHHAAVLLEALCAGGGLGSKRVLDGSPQPLLLGIELEARL